MRNQASNQRTIYHAEYLGIADVFDEYGYRTGDTAPHYSDPEKLRINVSTVKGEAENEAFGLYLDYDRTLFTTNMDCPIKEGSVIWLGKDPGNGDPYNYVVKRVADSKNALRYAIKEVAVSDGDSN